MFKLNHQSEVIFVLKWYYLIKTYDENQYSETFVITHPATEQMFIKSSDIPAKNATVFNLQSRQEVTG